MSIELAAKDQVVEDLEPDVDYDSFDFLDRHDRTWAKAMAQSEEEEKHLQETVEPLHRYTNEDIEWVQKKLKLEGEYLETRLRIKVNH